MSAKSSISGHGSTSVRLPARNGATTANAPPVWAITASEASDVTAAANHDQEVTAVDHTIPMNSKCSRHHPGRSGVCCRQLKIDERHLIDPDILRDVVIGLSDGLTVPFALTAGLASLGNSRVVVLGGVAELIAGAISMGIGAFLATQAERDQYTYLHAQTSLRVQKSCSGELEREVDEILGPIGVPASLNRQIAEALRKEEAKSHPNPEDPEQLKFAAGVGLTPFLLQFGPKHAEDISASRPYFSAMTIGLGYLIGGLIPLTPYFLIRDATVALWWSCLVTGIILLIFGAVKTYVTGAGGFPDGEVHVKTRWWKSGKGAYVYGALSTLAVGGAAAGAAFGIVRALEGVSGE